MRVTSAMLDKGLQDRYQPNRLFVFLAHQRWFAPLMLWQSRARHSGANIDGLLCEERHIPSQSGGPPIRSRIYRPLQASGPLPVMLYLHGGGYVEGIPEAYAPLVKDFIDLEPCIVIAPDYRKASDAPFPAAFNDCYDCLLWMRDHADALGGRADALIVAGHSAGGGLAAAVSLKATDTQAVKIAFQMPIYPMIDDRHQNPSVVGNTAPVCDAVISRNAWGQYLKGVGDVPPYAAAARGTDYSRLPPTITFVGSIEPFRDEAVTYVENLRKAGIPVLFEEFEGAFHAFDCVVPDAPISLRAKQFLARSYQEFYRRYITQT